MKLRKLACSRNLFTTSWNPRKKLAHKAKMKEKKKRNPFSTTLFVWIYDQTKPHSFGYPLPFLMLLTNPFTYFASFFFIIHSVRSFVSFWVSLEIFQYFYFPSYSFRFDFPSSGILFSSYTDLFSPFFSCVFKPHYEICLLKRIIFLLLCILYSNTIRIRLKYNHKLTFHLILMVWPGHVYCIVYVLFWATDTNCENHLLDFFFLCLFLLFNFLFFIWIVLVSVICLPFHSIILSHADFFHENGFCGETQFGWHFTWNFCFGIFSDRFRIRYAQCLLRASGLRPLTEEIMSKTYFCRDFRGIYSVCFCYISTFCQMKCYKRIENVTEIDYETVLQQINRISMNESENDSSKNCRPIKIGRPSYSRLILLWTYRKCEYNIFTGILYKDFVPNLFCILENIFVLRLIYV